MIWSYKYSSVISFFEVLFFMKLKPLEIQKQDDKYIIKAGIYFDVTEEYAEIFFEPPYRYRY